MPDIYAKEFKEISSTLPQNTGLRDLIISLIDAQQIAGKVTEGGDRLVRFKNVLKQLVRGELSLSEAYRETETMIPRQDSIHANDNRVFASGWGERLVRTQFSRFYNQAVLEKLLSSGQSQCFIPHSSEEDAASKCSRYLAGSSHNAKVLYERLINAYANGNWTTDLKIPEHPHCTHVVIPIE